jgi:hypothetical protein
MAISVGRGNMNKQPEEVLRFTRDEYNSGEIDRICELLREHRVSFARPGPHWFPTILPPYELVEDADTGHVIIRR